MKMLLNGQWVDRDKKIDVIDPFDNSVIDTVPAGNDKDVELALSSAVQGFQITKRMTVPLSAAFPSPFPCWLTFSLNGTHRDIGVDWGIYLPRCE